MLQLFKSYINIVWLLQKVYKKKYKKMNIEISRLK